MAWSSYALVFNEDDLLCDVQPTDYVPFIERFKAGTSFVAGPDRVTSDD